MRMRMRVGMVLTGAQLFLMTMPMASCALLVAPNVRLPHIETSRCQPVYLAAVEPSEVTLVLDITMPQQALMACAEKVKFVSARAAVAAAGVGLKLQALCTLRRMIIVAATLLISVGLRALWVSRVGSSSSSTTTTTTTTSTPPMSGKSQPLAKKSSAADQPAEQGSTAALASSLLSLAEVAAEGVVAAAAVALTSVSEINTPKEMSLAEQRAKVLAAADAFTANDVQGAANADPRALLLELRDVVGKQVELLEDMDSKLKSKSSEVRRLETALEALEGTP